MPVRVAVVAAADTVNDVDALCDFVPLHDELELFSVTVCHDPATLIPAISPCPVPSHDSEYCNLAVILNVILTDVVVLLDTDTVAV